MYEVSMIDGHIDESKMTDEQIIEGVNYCAKVKLVGKCQNCPVKELCDSEDLSFVPRVADLINRLEAEVESLEDECGKQSTLWSRHYESIFESAMETVKAEVKRLQQNLKEAHLDIEEHKVEIERMREISEALDIEHEAIKNCAVKEFAERLKENKIRLYGKWIVLVDDIDNLLKEMVGE